MSGAICLQLVPVPDLTLFCVCSFLRLLGLLEALSQQLDARIKDQELRYLWKKRDLNEAQDVVALK